MMTGAAKGFHDRFPWRWALPALAAVCICIWGCTDRLAGGSIEIGNSGKVTGQVLTLDGTAAANARVRLLPDSYDPFLADSLPSAWSVSTDAEGKYEISDVVAGAYNIEIRDSLGGTLALLTGVKASGLAEGQALPQPVAKLAEAGSISFAMDGESGEGYFYLPGTRVFTVPDSVSQVTRKVTLLGVPAARYAALIHMVPGISARNLLGRPISTKAGTELMLGPYHAWRFLRAVTVNAGPTGAGLKAGLGRFPLLVRLTSANFDFTTAKSNGEDIRFSKSDGITPLPFEIESWDALNKRAEIWVGLDTVAANNPTQTFLLYSGLPEAAVASNPGAVFDTASGFVGAWHLGISLKDATGIGNHGMDSGATPAAGLVAKARQFDGTGRHVGVRDNASLRFGTGDFCLSAWIFVDSIAANNQVFAKRSAEGNYEVQLRSGGTLLAALDQGGTPGLALHGATALRKGVWYHVAFVRAAGQAMLYLNGALEAGPVDAPQNADTPAELSFGDDPAKPGVEGFRGKIDEVEFSRTARSEDWLKLIYATQKPASAIVLVAPAE